MFACSITPYSHGDAAKKLLKKLGAQVHKFTFVENWYYLR